MGMSRRQQAPGAGWAALPRGRFTGVDWAAADAMDRADPYLAWAEASDFAGFRAANGAPADPQWLPLLIELRANHTVADLLAAAHPDWLQVPRVYRDLPADLRFCTARVRRGFFRALRPGGPLQALVARYDLGLPVGHHAQPLPHHAADGASPAPAHHQVGGDVMVVIDNGLALAHTDFLTGAHRTRVAAFWRQDATQGPHGRAAASLRPVPLDPARCGPTPADLGYGHELDQAAIQAAIDAHVHQGRVDEDGLYRHWQMWEQQHSTNHGTHVTSLAAGPQLYTRTIGTEGRPPDWQPVGDAASRARLVVAQLDWASVADSSGGALTVSVMDALAWALARCAVDARVTVNLSWGALAGPHNGSSMLEAGMAQLIAASGRACRLVVPAGNAYQARTHASVTLPPGQSATLHWRVQPDDHSQSFLELWFADKQDANRPLEGLALELTPPGATGPLPPIKLGSSGVWPSAAAPQAAIVFATRSALGHPGACALIALAPTATWFQDSVTTRAGRWQVRLVHAGKRRVVADAYIERDDVALGAADTGARQSYLEDRHYDTSGGLGGFIDHPDNPSLVRRSGTFNDIATGSGTVSVGGIRYFGSCMDPMARYSPRLPDPDAGRPERTGVQKMPDRLAVSDESVSLWGVRAAGTRSAAAVRLVGTSMAAPQVARDLLNQRAQR
jgi:flavin-binding protein dodecin